MRYRNTVAFALVAFAVCVAQQAMAVSPTLGMILPRGGMRGTDVDLTITGGALGDAVDLMFHEQGIKLASIKADNDTTVKAKVTIAPDCEVGTHAIRVRTKTGVTNMLLFSVGTLKEAQEKEPNNSVKEATPAEMDTVINGVVAAEDVDYYSVDLAAGQRVAVEVEGIRLGGEMFDPKLRLFDTAGHELIAEDDTQLLKQDAGFVYTAKDAGKYFVALSEASYGGSGGSYYRLNVGKFPFPLSVSPLGGVKGAALQLNWLGDPGMAKQAFTVPDLKEGTRAIPVKNDAEVEPMEMPFRVSKYAGVMEVEPNDEPAKATPGPAPGAFEGIIDKAGDHDYFKITGKKGEVYDVRVWARALGSPLDSFLVIAKLGGAQIAADDDAAGIDSQARITLPEDGDYTICVYDHLLRGGPTFAYRVEVTPVAPQLNMKLLENKPVQLTVPQGNQSYLLVSAARADFDGPIKVDLPDAPAGVTAVCDTLAAGQTTLPVIVTAAADAAVAGSLARVHGTLVKDGQDLQGDLNQEITLIYGRNETTFFGRDVDRLAVAVSEPAPFKLELVAPKAPVVHGGYADLTVKATRKEGFKAPIDLRFPWLPPGMGGGTAQIPADKNEITIRLEVSGGTAVATHKLFVAGTAGGYTLCTPFTPVEVQAPWVTFNVASVGTDQGKPVEVTVDLKQVKPYDGEFEVVLDGLPKGVTTTPQKFKKDTTVLKFPLTVAPDAPEGKYATMIARAAIEFQGEKVRHNSGQGQLQIFKPLPPTLASAAPDKKPEAKAADAGRKTRFPTT